MAVAKSQPQDGEVPSKEVDLDSRLAQIRNSPKLQNQQQTAIVLSAVEETLKEQKSERTPTAYFAALLSLLKQAPQGNQKDVASAVVYLLDLVMPHVSQPLLRSKFSVILETLAPALTRGDADAPFLRSSIGSLETLLVVQDSQAWALPQSQAGPRRATAGLLQMAGDPRPKVRKRAAEALVKVLQNGPPGPSLDHPAADMCAETALRSFQQLATSAVQGKKQKGGQETQAHEPGLIHALQLIKTIASATGGWPSRSLDSLCEVLFTVAKSKSEFLTMAAFDVFETIFEGMATNNSYTKLPRLLEAVSELQPSQEDTQLLPPWLAVLSRGYDVSAQIEPEETFQKLPELFTMVSAFLASGSYNIRVSAAECLVSLLINCIPVSVILEPSIMDEKITEKICRRVTDLLSVKYQSSWMEVFSVVGAALEAFRWRATPALNKAVTIIGELRANESFSGKAQADEVISKAIRAMGPEIVLEILPLNLITPKAGQPGRAWMLPLMRDSVRNTNLSHFRKELVPLSEKMFSRVLGQAPGQKSMEAKIFETVVQQIWATLPGYCDGALDIRTAFDQEFAEMLAKLLYQQPEMRNILCKSMQNLVDSNKMISEMEGEENLLAQGRISKADAILNLEHLGIFANNLISVLFNVYIETATQYRGPVLGCMDSYLSITKPDELSQTFGRVASELDNAIREETAQKAAQAGNKPPAKDTKTPLSHALMDIIVTLSIYLPREAYQNLFTTASIIIAQQQDAQLQKKAYKLIPRLAQSPNGKAAITARNAQLQQLLLQSADLVMIPARRDRIAALSEIVESLPPTELHFLPTILSEVILCTKETNERARQSAFDLIVQIGQKMAAGGSIDQARINGGTGDPDIHEASIDEYAVMLSAGLAGTTPHMISATVTALSLVLFHFKSQLSDAAIADMVATMDLFLSSPSREIVRSVLGFVKVCIISLPIPFMQPRLQTLIPSLMNWSKEHKAHFKVKVKNILERMIRRFGVEVVERWCPEEDRRLVANIRKSRERKKKKRAAEAEAGDGEDGEKEDAPTRKGKFENEFDEAIYGSDDDDDEDSDSASDADDDPIRGATGAGKKGGSGRNQTYIHEDTDEPLDLLDRKSLARISSTRPIKPATVPLTKRKAKTDVESGKLLFKEDDQDGDEDMPDLDNASVEQGINAYVAAIKGRDVARRGQGGRLKFTNKREKGGEGDEEEDGDGDDGKEIARVVNGRGGRGDSRGRGGRGSERGRGGAGRGGGGRSDRRPLGADKTRGGRIEKSGGGGGRGRGGGRGGSGFSSRGGGGRGRGGGGSRGNRR